MICACAPMKKTGPRPEADAFLFQADAFAEAVVAQRFVELIFAVREPVELAAETAVFGFAGPQ